MFQVPLVHMYTVYVQYPLRHSVQNFATPSAGLDRDKTALMNPDPVRGGAIVTYHPPNSLLDRAIISKLHLAQWLF